ncbi:alpha/beta fold hydrolase [Streptomyces sp. NPDC002667]|uniref:alpha/beta fold hydrolase n=1 Tax=Streptomyces sp. NPDC002667 TaxID=3364657 RepID=UPI0036C4D4C4
MSGEAEFLSAYDTVLRQWPVRIESVDVPTPYGTTRVHVSGPENGTPLLLLPGGGATSAVWFANIGALTATHRVYAPDLIGDIGRSVHDGAPLRGADDLTAWLDTLFDELHLDGAQVCGHSYGAWIALHHALRAPRRIGRLALLDPTNCFAGMRPGYLARALPMLLRPTGERVRAFHRWETGGTPEHPAWQAFLDSTAGARRSKVVAARRPKPADLRACAVPVLVILAGRSRAHDVPRVAARVRGLMPTASVDVLPEASHHSLPTERPAELNRLLAQFLA